MTKAELEEEVAGNRLEIRALLDACRALEKKLELVRAYVTDECFDSFYTQDILDILDDT